jgi:hypothetical protein
MMGDDMTLFRVAVVGVILLTANSKRPSKGQDAPANVHPWQSQASVTSQKPDNPAKEQQEKMLIAARQKQIVAGADKLVSLATELKAQIDKMGAGTLSVDEVKKADEIEKLAHSLKARLRG